jgi:type II secretion system protein J
MKITLLHGEKDKVVLSVQSLGKELPCPRWSNGGCHSLIRGFTLIEILVAVVLFSLVLLGLHEMYSGVLRLHNKVSRAAEDILPVEYALSVIKRDLSQLMSPGQNSVLVQPLQTVSSVDTVFVPGFEGRQVSPEFYTASGTVSDDLPWGNVRRVVYCVGSINGSPEDTQLVRLVWRNLLPVLTDTPEVEPLISGVKDVVFLFYDGVQWVTYWDATAQERPLPYAIKVQIELINTNLLITENPTITITVPVRVDGLIINANDEL